MQYLLYYVSSHDLIEQGVDYFHQSIRGHWGGCEIRNHWIRDHLWAEDKTRIRTWTINANLSLMRCLLLNMKCEIYPQRNWAEFFQYHSHFPTESLQLLNLPRSKW